MPSIKTLAQAIATAFSIVSSRFSIARAVVRAGGPQKFDDHCSMKLGDSVQVVQARVALFATRNLLRPPALLPAKVFH